MELRPLVFMRLLLLLLLFSWKMFVMEFFSLSINILLIHLDLSQLSYFDLVKLTTDHGTFSLNTSSCFLVCFESQMVRSTNKYFSFYSLIIYPSMLLMTLEIAFVIICIKEIKEKISKKKLYVTFWHFSMWNKFMQFLHSRIKHSQWNMRIFQIRSI